MQVIVSEMLLVSSLRLLLRILRQQQSSFVLQRSENVLQSTDEVLQRLNPKETTLQTLTEVRTCSWFWICIGLLGLGQWMGFNGFSHVYLPGDVRGPDPREDEGGLPRRGESGQCAFTKL